MKTRNPGPALPLHKRILFATVAVGSCLLLAEGVLLAVGVAPVLQTSDPYVGFVGRLRLYEDAGDGVTLRTAANKLAYFNMQTFPRHRPEGAFRVFCVGGSTTYGRPYDDRTSFSAWLRTFLRELVPERQWEVINAGGISYASYRVAALMEELVEYEPDLFVVYTGHNEFLERRTYGSVRSTPSWIRELDLLASRTRLYSLLKRWRGGAAARTGDASRPENLLPAEVRTRLDGSVGPRDYTRDDVQARGVIEHYRFNLERMVDIAHRAGAEIVFVAPAANLADCSPFKSEFAPGVGGEDQERWRRSMQLAEDALAEGDLESALEAVEAALEVDSRRADAHFLHGKVLAALHRWDEAKGAFERAVDEDVCPLRALTGFRSIVREVARQRGVDWIDYPALLESRTPHGIPGEDLFLDHVHPTVEGHRVLAEALVDWMRGTEIVPRDRVIDPAVRERVGRSIAAEIDPEVHAAALRNLAKVLHWAGKTDEAERLVERALALVPNDADALLQKGLTLQAQGAYDSAVEVFTQAIDLRPDSARLRAARGSALLEAGAFEDALIDLEWAVNADSSHVGVWNNLGSARLRAGDVEGARFCFARARELDPTDVSAWNNEGALDLELRDFEAAEGAYREALRRSPRHVSSQYGLGVALGQQGRNEEALTVFDELLGWQPQHIEARYARAVLLARLGRREAALAELRGVLDQDPGHEAARRKLAQLLGN